MHCLIIGGTRFIGPRVVRILDSVGWQVTIAHRGKHKADLPSGVREINHPALGMPVTNIPPTLREVAPDVVLLMIAMGERDAKAAMHSFEGYTGRVVAVSSGDVYRAYGCFIQTEAATESTPLNEQSPLREHLYPYRDQAESAEQLEHWYEKILMERAVMACPELPGTILRLPKVYGPGENDNLATVFGYRHYPKWRWTHGHVVNVASAIALAVTNDSAAGHIFNVGEANTPTVGERLAYLPEIDVSLADIHNKNMDQDLNYDTTKIRRLLGFCDTIDEVTAMIEVAHQWLMFH